MNLMDGTAPTPEATASPTSATGADATMAPSQLLIADSSTLEHTREKSAPQYQPVSSAEENVSTSAASGAEVHTSPTGASLPQSDLNAEKMRLENSEQHHSPTPGPEGQAHIMGNPTLLTTTSDHITPSPTARNVMAQGDEDSNQTKRPSDITDTARSRAANATSASVSEVVQHVAAAQEQPSIIKKEKSPSSTRRPYVYTDAVIDPLSDDEDNKDLQSEDENLDQKPNDIEHLGSKRPSHVARDPFSSYPNSDDDFIDLTGNVDKTTCTWTAKSEPKLNQDDASQPMDLDADGSEVAYTYSPRHVDGMDSDSDSGLFVEEDDSGDYSPGSDDDFTSGKRRNSNVQDTTYFEQAVDIGMHEQVEYDMAMDELREMITKCDELQEKQASGQMTAHERVRLRILEGKIQAEKVRLKVSDSHDVALGTGPADHMCRDGIATEPTAKPRKKLGPRAKTAKEYFAKHGSGFDICGGFKKRKPSDDAAHTRSSKKAKKTTKSAKVTKKASPDLEDPRAKFFHSLCFNNPIEARLKFGDVKETNVTAKTKIDQLNQLTGGATSDSARTAADRRTLKFASEAFGYNMCKANNGEWEVNGMQALLKNHQIIGSAWMLRREFNENAPFGGLVADEMGMGKTVEMLACIVNNQPSENDLQRWSKTTLIVVPSSLLSQWKAEIQKHIKATHSQEVLVYKMSMGLPKSALTAVDIILTTYHEILAEYPSAQYLKDLREEGYKGEEYEEKFKAKLGPLFKIDFWRVVLDEAHAIKNKNSQTSLACCDLPGRLRWAMSGTPLQNSLDEFYPYLKFVKAGFVSDFPEFQKKYSNTKDDAATKRLQEMVSEIMLHRTSSDKFMGKPLFVIPTPHSEDKTIRLTNEERVIYRVVQSRFIKKLNEYLSKSRRRGLDKDETKKAKDVKLYLLYLLRLRQATAHPFLLETVMKRDLHPGDLVQIKTKLAEIGGRQPVYEQIKAWCTNVTNELDQLNANSGTKEFGTTEFGTSKFGYNLNMNKQIDMAFQSRLEHICRICFQTPQAPKRSDCDHLFCAECIAEHVATTFQDKEGNTKCPECDRLLTGLTEAAEDEIITELGTPEMNEGTQSVVNAMDRNLYEMFEAVEAPATIRGRDQRKLGNDVFDCQPKAKKSTTKFIRECDKKYPGEPMVPSSKATAVKDTTIRWLKEAEDDKIIIFTQWKPMGMIIGRMLQDEGIPFLYFFGDMSKRQKEAAIKGFHDKPEVKVMVASLKCGGVGLNLTCANRVILIDLWWNHSIEMQAFGRVFRISQKKETYFQRIMTKDTIDQRLNELQQKKLEQIDKAMQAGKTLNDKVSIEELASLFGDVEQDSEGMLRIIAPEDDDDDF
ncbi:uncharacterized protein JN550_000806 [Neoarthrinium moseri]|uniref:uncharacterized protein n=1 Tax=Neoarthrinium moseri TaxID=1658444 RepID=UPI001FDE296E|nr:uncharacterized protein JN550_000806 [Neoarthrinium moseri]KAI1876734.1 hypothetical protein JN550_000806 [Neoarthrinium moseri]